MSGIFGDPTLPRGLPGSWCWGVAHRQPVVRRFPRVFVCHCGITTRRVACVGRCSTVGVITHSLVAAVEIGFCATTLSAMWSALQSRSSRQSRLNLRSLASSSPRGRPILEVPTPMSTPSFVPPLLLPPLRLPLVAAPADIWVPRSVSGFAEAWDFSVSSLLRSSHLSSASPSVADVFHEVETPKRAFQDTASLVAERGATFCPLVLEACGCGWSQAFQGVVVGLPPNPVRPAAWPPTHPRTPASGLHSA